MNEQSNDIREILNSLTENDFRCGTDLHMHSNCSDGRLSFEELIEDAKTKNYKLIAIADHNTIEGHKKEHNTAELKLLQAIEFDCWYKGVLVHLLGYGIDIYNKELLALCAKTKKRNRSGYCQIVQSQTPERCNQSNSQRRRGCCPCTSGLLLGYKP